jgi:hypothetical protein
MSRGGRFCSFQIPVGKWIAPWMGPSPVAVGSLLVGLLLGVSMAWTTPVRAQQVAAPTLVVPAMLRAEPATRAAVPIQARVPDATRKGIFVRVRGLPVMVALSDGHVIAPGVWAVPLDALPTLEIIIPAGINAEASVAINLVTINGDVLAETKMQLVIGGAVAPAAKIPAPARASPAVVPRPPAVPTPTPEELESMRAMHNRGLEQLERGNIEAARRFFERAAKSGSAQSALALGLTYDPEELAARNVIGMQSNLEEARKWYEKANELGAAEAQERLRRLSRR